MVRRALCLISWLVLAACASKPLPVIDLLKTKIETRNGITYVDALPFTGIALALNALDPTDTIEMRQYLNGKEDGCWKKFFAKGKPMMVKYFSEGKKNGHHFTWWENGVLKSDHAFENDELEGESKDWHFNGRLVRLMHYHQGHESGMQQQWTTEGKLWANYEARDGRNYGLTGTKACATLWDKQQGHVQ